MLFVAQAGVLEVRQRVEGAPRLFCEFFNNRRLELDLAGGGEELVARLLILEVLLLASHVLHVVVELLKRHAHGRELEVKHVLRLGTPPLVFLAETNCQAVPEFVVVTEVNVSSAFETVDDTGLCAKVHGTMVHDGIAVIGPLEPGCCR